MCGRYQFSAEQADEVLQIIQEVQDKVGAKAAAAIPRGEITPGCKMPVLVASEDGAAPELMVWGFRMPRSTIINAKAETALEKPTFAESVRCCRCVVPSTGFYEWDGDKRKYHFTLPGSQVLWMAGLFDMRSGVPCFVILTTAANESLREIHDRMPLMLTREQIEPWLRSAKMTEQFLAMTPPLLDARPTDAQIKLW
ncbi:MAG: SOS response-associated peptidase [Ruminococcaceae bacterium]|nr:SOS response-associated peptidase [Oscillospiraceae bacterium]